MIALAAIWLMSFSAGPDSPADARRETVVLAHGLMNRPVVMKLLESALERLGYKVVNWGYPSRDKTVEEHARDLGTMVKSLNETDTLHFVGFSLGGLIVRYFLAHDPPPHAGRAVLIAPPNHGSERADQLYRYAWFRTIWGEKSSAQLICANQDFFDSCGVPPSPFGIIAGGRGDGKGYSRILPGDDDGSVSVSSAWLAGAADTVILHHQHTLLLFGSDTHRQVIAFIEKGAFDP